MLPGGEKTPRGNVKNGAFKKVRLPSSPRPPRRRASKVRRCTFCQRPATAAPARTPAPVPPLGIRALLARLRSCTPRPRGNWGSHCSSAAGAAHRAPTSSSCSAPQNPHSPVSPVGQTLVPSHGPLPRRPRPALEPQIHLQRAAPCTAHRSHCPASRTSRSFLLRSPQARPPARHLVGTAARQTRRFPEL